MKSKNNNIVSQEYLALTLIAKQAGKITKKYFKTQLKTEEKETPADFRTIADTESEKFIINKISKLFPDYNIHTEEFGFVDNGSEFTFIIDPLDGTNNFALGIPNYSVSISLVRGATTLFGVVYHPVLDDLYYAEIKKGAYKNGLRISTSKTTDIKRASVTYTCGYVNSNSYRRKIVKGCSGLNVKRILDNWSPAFDFCLLASGRIEVIVNNQNEVYDFSAGKLIAKEAGAIITDFDGKKEKDSCNSQFIASNCKKIHSSILGVL